MTISTKRTDLLEFPCTFPIKALGRAEEDFEALVLALVGAHVPRSDLQGVSRRLSANGNYLAVTATVTARSRRQLDGIYHSLSAEPRIRVAL